VCAFVVGFFRVAALRVGMIGRVDGFFVLQPNLVLDCWLNRRRSAAGPRAAARTRACSRNGFGSPLSGLAPRPSKSELRKAPGDDGSGSPCSPRIVESVSTRRISQFGSVAGGRQARAAMLCIASAEQP
jgi:hypothetical protein